MTKWIASLSDGRTIEEENLFVAGEKSPYQKLLDIIEKDKVTLTGFRIQVNGITFVAPSNSKVAKFPSSVKVNITHRKRAEMKLGDANSDNYYGYYFEIGETKIYNWINSKTGDSWIQVVKNDNQKSI